MAIVGAGELEAETKQLISDKKLEGNVAFLGFNSNPYKILHDAKLMIMTSRWEGTPMCALEAMALGVPIVSTPTDGLKELVTTGETGYLCETDDELVEACISVVEEAAKQVRLSENSAQKAQEIMCIEAYKKRISASYH